MIEVESVPLAIKPTSMIIADASSLPLKVGASVSVSPTCVTPPTITRAPLSRRPTLSTLTPSKFKTKPSSTVSSTNTTTTSTKSSSPTPTPTRTPSLSKRSSFSLNRLSIVSLDSTSSSPFSLFQKKLFSSLDSNNINLSHQTSRSTSPTTSPELSSLSSSSSPPSPSSSLATSPNATTISSTDGSSSISRSLNLASPENCSLISYDEYSTPNKKRASRIIRRKSFDNSNASLAPKDEFLKDFKLLESELPKFQSKSGVHRANILRLALLPFLRQHRGEEYFIKCAHSKEINQYRIKILHKWWSAILNTFKERLISGSDRSLYLEGLSGLLSRHEFRTNLPVYQQLLYETIQLVISKLSLKTVPLSVAAFCGRVLAYGFFFAPSIAPVLLHLLAVPQVDIDRVIKCSFTEQTDSSSPKYFHHHHQQFTSCTSLSDSNLVLTSTCNFPKHLESLIGYSEGRKSAAKIPSKSIMYNNASRFYRPAAPPPPPPAIPNIYGPWSRRWASSNSDVFIAFIKHYYSIMSTFITVDLPWNAHLSSPGLLILHSFLLGSFDFAVHPHERRVP